MYWNFVWNWVESVTAFRRITIFTILIPLIHEYEDLYIFRYLHQSFLLWLKVFIIQVFSYFLELSQDILILFFCERNYFLDFFPVCLSFIPRRATDFWVLILYFDTFLQVFIRFKGFLVDFQGHIYAIISSAHNILWLLPLLFVFPRSPSVLLLYLRLKITYE